MNSGFSLEMIQMQMLDTIQELERCNDLTEKYGLSLSNQQIQNLVENRFKALENNGRVEFGEGVLQKLIYAFCDSPYLTQENYEETILSLQDMFYYFKNESMEELPDDELIESMKFVFDGKACGSIEYLSGTSLENLCRSTRFGSASDEEMEEFDEYREWYYYSRQHED